MKGSSIEVCKKCHRLLCIMGHSIKEKSRNASILIVGSGQQTAVIHHINKCSGQNRDHWYSSSLFYPPQTFKN